VPVYAASYKELAAWLTQPPKCHHVHRWRAELFVLCQCSAHPHSRQLAGLVVLPTRDLAVQVHRVLSALGTASGVTVALAAAQESVAAEAAGLVSHPSQPKSGPQLLIATPGRLMAHLQNTAGFSLSGLRFLVVDEADRLLRQDYQGWLPEVLRQIQAHGSSQQQLQQQQQQQLQQDPQPHMQAPDLSSGGSSCSSSSFLSPMLPCSGSDGSSSPRLLKLVVSATLTRDPSKLLRLELHYPRYITLAGVMHRCAAAASLAVQAAHARCIRGIRPQSNTHTRTVVACSTSTNVCCCGAWGSRGPAGL
jgi:ATP-dependent RNA helicase DDX51/DBP6